MNQKEKQLQKKMIKVLIYLLVSAIFLGFVIFITVWEKTKGASLGWYYFLAIFFFLISLIRVALVRVELMILRNPDIKMRR